MPEDGSFDPEPHPVPAGGSPTPRAAGRNLKVRLATGLPLAAAAVALLYVSRLGFFVLVLAIVVVAQGEFYLATRRAGYDPATALGLVAGAMLLIGIFSRGDSVAAEAAAGLVLFLTVAFSFVWYVALQPSPNLLVNVGITVLGVGYVPLLASFLVALANRPDGFGIALATIGGPAVYDVIAYFGGSRFGRKPLAPTISPKKTREGALIATAGILVLGTLVFPLAGPWNVPQAAVFAALVCVMAPLGDLFESVLKRDLGIKDMGTVFPGHGGALDRVDAILFCVPAAYLSLSAFGL